MLGATRKAGGQEIDVQDVVSQEVVAQKAVTQS